MNHKEVIQYRDDIRDRLTRLEEKGNAHFEVTREIRVDVKAQNARVRKLETTQSWLMGGLGAITFVFGSLMAWIKGS